MDLDRTPEQTVVRPLGPSDAEAARRLGWEAFGDPPPEVRDTAATWPPRPGMTGVGLFGPGGDLRARAVDRAFDSWFGGVVVPTCGVAGVTVAVEHRGAGLLRPVFEALLAAARERGAVVSTLYPTAPRIYRGFGYEVVGSLDTVELETAALAAVRVPPTDLVVRRATVADVPGVRAAYDAWASAQHGPLTRRGESFPATDGELLTASTGLTVAVDPAGTVHGWAAWSRGTGVGEGRHLRVQDLVATRVDATALLLRVLGGFASVTPLTRQRTSGGPVGDPVRLLLPGTGWRPVEQEPYMLRLLRPDAALESRGYPPAVRAELSFTLADELLHDLDGGWRLAVDGGRATCTRGPAGGPHFTGRGLALLWSGALRTADLRAAGLLSGDDADDPTWDLLLGGRVVHVRDYF